jgi:two-component system, CitB family, sensor kinase
MLGRIRVSRRGSAIASQVLALQLAIVLATIGVVGAVSLRQARLEYDRLYGERVLGVARSVAALPAVVEAFDEPNPSAIIQPIAEAVRVASGADFVVVANREQIRYSHPDPAKVGERLSTDASDVLRGETFVGTEQGTLGNSVRGKTPVYSLSGAVIGIVSVGILQESVSTVLWRYVRSALASIAGSSLLFGGVGSYLVARRLRRQTYSLDPEELSGILEQREAVLHGIKEGVLAFDVANRVTVINEQAVRLLDLPSSVVGDTLPELGLSSQLLACLTGPLGSPDILVEQNGIVLILNRMPVAVRGKTIGWVVTLRDQTELVSLQTELLGLKSSSDALRAQAHEFSNRLHTIAGLLALESYDEAVRFTTGTAKAQAALTTDVLRRFSAPAVAALLIAKSVSAREHDAELIISNDSSLSADADSDPTDLLLVLGNLIDNGLQALGGSSDELLGGWVEVSISESQDGVLVRVMDSGSGVDRSIADSIFDVGVSTKAGTRGLGLSLAQRACERRGGTLSFDGPTGEGLHTQFTAWLPHVASNASGALVRRFEGVSRG